MATRSSGHALTPREAAEKYGVTVSTVYRWMESGLAFKVIERKVPRPPPPPRIVRSRAIPVGALETWVSEVNDARGHRR